MALNLNLKCRVCAYYPYYNSFCSFCSLAPNVNNTSGSSCSVVIAFDNMLRGLGELSGEAGPVNATRGSARSQIKGVCREDVS